MLPRVLAERRELAKAVGRHHQQAGLRRDFVHADHAVTGGQADGAHAAAGPGAGPQTFNGKLDGLPFSGYQYHVIPVGGQARGYQLVFLDQVHGNKPVTPHGGKLVQCRLLNLSSAGSHQHKGIRRKISHRHHGRDLLSLGNRE